MSQDTESLLSSHIARAQLGPKASNSINSAGTSAAGGPPGGIPAHRRGRLLTPLYGCKAALAVPLSAISREFALLSTVLIPDVSLTSLFFVYDPIHKVNEWDLQTIADEGGEFYLPAGTCFDCHWAEDAQRWEYESAGLCCINEVSEESELSEGSEGSEASQSELSEGSQSEQSELSEHSELSQQSEASEEGSGKTAIVPSGLSPTGYTALFIGESPEVRFYDLLRATISIPELIVPIDPKFIEVCEPNSIEVCGHATDEPWPVGLKVIDKTVRIRRHIVGFDDLRGEVTPLEVTVHLTGIRKGFAGIRFPDRTKEQFEANERFLRSASMATSPQRALDSAPATKPVCPTDCSTCTGPSSATVNFPVPYTGDTTVVSLIHSVCDWAGTGDSPGGFAAIVTVVCIDGCWYIRLGTENFPDGHNHDTELNYRSEKLNCGEPCPPTSGTFTLTSLGGAGNIDIGSVTVTLS